MQIPLLADRTWTLSNANKQICKDTFVLSRALIKYYLGHLGGYLRSVTRDQFVDIFKGGATAETTTSTHGNTFKL